MPQSSIGVGPQQICHTVEQNDEEDKAGIYDKLFKMFVKYQNFTLDLDICNKFYYFSSRND